MTQYVKNTDNLNEVLNWLKNGGQHMKFNMGTLVAITDNSPDCGSACCIAGACAQFAGHTPEDVKGMYATDIVYTACEYLGISDIDAAQELFQMEVQTEILEKVTADEAYTVLETYAYTGKVTWVDL